MVECWSSSNCIIKLGTHGHLAVPQGELAVIMFDEMQLLQLQPESWTREGYGRLVEGGCELSLMERVLGDLELHDVVEPFKVDAASIRLSQNA